MDIQELRRDRTRELLSEHGWTVAEFARRAGKQPSQINDMLAGRKSYGEKVAREIEQKLALPPGWMDQAHGEGSAFEPASPAAPLDAAEVMRRAGDIFARMNERERKAALDLLSRYAEAPEGGEALLRALDALVEAD